MIRNAGFLVLAAILLQSCADLGSSTEPGLPSESELVSGKFVVDLFAMECIVKVNPGNDSLWAYFPYTLKYHFEGSPGSITGIDFFSVGSLRTSLFLTPVYPDSISKLYVFSHGFWTNSSLAQQDSVVVHYALSGSYWKLAGGDLRTLGTFDWGTEQKIAVRHQ